MTSLNPITIELRGQVGGPAFNVTQVRTALDTAGGSPVRVVIASNGGCAATGCAVHAMLQDYPEVSTIIEFAGSAAVAPALAAPRRSILTSGSLFIHRAWQSAVGTALDMQRTGKRLQDLDRMTAETYAQASGQSVKRILELMDQSTVLDAHQAQNLGFVQAVLNEPGGQVIPPEDRPKTAYTIVRTNREALTDQAPAAVCSRGEAIYQAGMLTSFPLPPGGYSLKTPAESVELRRRNVDQLNRLYRRLMAFASGLAPDPRRRPPNATWRCSVCNALNYHSPDRNGRPTPCTTCPTEE